VLAELKQFRERMVEVVTPPRSVMGISDALVDLGTFPIWDIAEHSKSSHDVLMTGSIILEHLREEHAPGSGSWV
jgi:hypothetical protein